MELTRRDALTTVGLTAIAAAVAATGASAQQMPGATPIRKPTKKRINQSVCQWCYQKHAAARLLQGRRRLAA